MTCTESEDVKFAPKLRGSICAQIAQPPLENHLIALLDFNESDPHSVFSSGNDTAGGRDFRACMNDSDLDFRPGLQGSWGRHKAAMHAQIAGTRGYLPFRKHIGDRNCRNKWLSQRARALVGFQSWLQLDRRNPRLHCRICTRSKVARQGRRSSGVAGSAFRRGDFAGFGLLATLCFYDDEKIHQQISNVPARNFF